MDGFAMSLINQMLQDLEKRQPGGETHPLSAVRAVPRYRRVPYFWPLLLLLAVAASVLAWQLLQAPASPKPAPPPALAAAPSTPPPPAAEPEPVPDPLPEAPAEPAQSAEAPVPAAAVAPPAASRPLAPPSLKESTELSFVPKPAAPAPKIASQPPAPQAAPPAAPRVAPVTQAAADTAAPASVTKQVREFSPQQRAEIEYRKALPLVQQGRITEAIDALSLAVQQDARHAAARQTLIGLLVEARRFGEAERRLQEGLGLDRAQPELAMTLARLQVERGDTDAAIVTLERTQSAAIDRADYQAFMAALLQREGRHPEAIEHYRQALRRAPNSAVWQMGLGISLQTENRYQEAREAFNRAKSANTLSPELQSFVEQRLRQLGQ